MIILISYFQLFIISFLAATILPLSSELVLSTMLLTDSFDKYLLLVVASFGNILGSSVNWYLGKKILIFKDKKWFPANERQIAKGEIYFRDLEDGFSKRNEVAKFCSENIFLEKMNFLRNFLSQSFYLCYIMVQLNKYRHT